jgi:hypothetical protein
MWEFLEDIWDWIVDAFIYVFTFEWFGDVADFFASMFENLGEFSIFGLVFGVIGAGTVYLARDYMLHPFLVHFSPAMAIFWGAVTYIGTFFAGYLVGNHFENTG